MTAVTAVVFDGTSLDAGTAAVASLALTPTDHVITYTVGSQVTVMKAPV